MSSHPAGLVRGLATLAWLTVLAAAAPAAAENRVLQQYGTRYEVTVRVFTRSVRQEEGWRHGIGRDARDLTCEPRQFTTEPCEPYECGRQETWVECFPHDCVSGGPVRPDGAVCQERCLRYEPKICHRRECPVMEDWCKYSRDYWIFSFERRVEAVNDSVVRDPPGLPEASADIRLERTEKFSVGFWEWDAARRTAKETYEYRPADAEEFKTFMAFPSGRWLCDVSPVRSLGIKPLRRVK